MDIMQIFNEFALPIAVIIALMWYIVYQGKQYQERVKELTQAHKSESEAFTAALEKNADIISRNTVVLERLCTMMGDKEGTV